MTNQPTPNLPGQVITFYSYKGGVGRSMALANVACMLAQAQVEERDARGVLVVDWDLEAPGLHRFFGDHFTRHFQQNKVTDEILNQQLGLIDLFVELNQATLQPDWPQDEDEESAAKTLVNQLDLPKFIIKTDVPQLSLLKAGRRDDGYWQRVNTFPWEPLFKRAPYLYRALAERWAAEYRYVLIDSRTGETDTSGVCTMIMPEKLVVVFTPNQQSLQGVRDLSERALRYRRGSDDFRNLAVFPLPSRIEASETELRENWRKNEDYGYQPMFERLFRAAYDLKQCDLNEYFDEVQIQHKPRYAYGEAISMLIETRSDRLSLSRSFSDFAKRLIGTRQPWRQEETSLADSPAAKQALLAEASVKDWSLAEQQTLMRALTRLVNVGDPQTSSRGDVAQPATVNEFNQAELELLRRLTGTGVLTMQRDEVAQQEAVKFAEPSLVHHWQRLPDEIEPHRDFLLWRQRLQGQIAEWQAGRGAYLVGPALDLARGHLTARPQELNQAEQDYITQSINAFALQSNKRRRNFAAVAALILIGLAVIAILVFVTNKQGSEVQGETLANEGRVAAQNADYDKAVEKYREALQLGADPTKTSVSLGDALKALGNDDEALTSYSAALEKDSTLNDALLGRGQVYVRRGEYDKAINDLNQVAASNETDPYTKAAALREIGEANLRKGDAEKAIASQTQALALDPDDAASYLSRATAYKNKGTKNKEAIEDFQRALSLSRDDQITESAKQGLVQLRVLPRESPTPTPSPLPTLAVTPKPMVAVVTRIFLQYQDKDDRGTVKALGNALGSYGKVQGTEYVTQPTTGDVRYFYPEDADKAAQIRAATQTFFNKQGSPLKIALRYPRGSTSKAARGWIEVWIPSLKAAKSEANTPLLNLKRDLKQRPILPNGQQSKRLLDGQDIPVSGKVPKKS